MKKLFVEGIKGLLAAALCGMGAVYGVPVAREANIEVQASAGWEEVGDKLVHKELGHVDTVNGRPDRAAEYYLYVTGASWCPYSRECMPDIVQAYEAMRSEKVEMIFIGYDEDNEAVRKWLAEKGAEFPGVHKDAEGVGALPGFEAAAGMPGVAFVTPEGVVLRTGHARIVPRWRQILAKSRDKDGNPVASTSAITNSCRASESKFKTMNPSMDEVLGEVNFLNDRPSEDAKYLLLFCGTGIDNTGENPAVEESKAAVADMAEEYEAMRSRGVEVILLADSAVEADAMCERSRRRFCASAVDSSSLKIPGVKKLKAYAQRPVAAIVEVKSGEVLAVGEKAVAQDWELVLDIREDTLEEK